MSHLLSPQVIMILSVALFSFIVGVLSVKYFGPKNLIEIEAEKVIKDVTGVEIDISNKTVKDPEDAIKRAIKFGEEAYKTSKKHDKTEPQP